MTAKLSDERCIEVLRAVDRFGSKAEAARQLNVAHSSISRTVDIARRRGISIDSEVANQEEYTDWREGEESASLSINTHTRIRTLEDALEYAEVDQDVWEATKFSVVSHEQAQKDSEGNPRTVQLWNVRVELRRRKHNHPIVVKEETKEWLKSYSPKIPKPKSAKKKSSELVLEIACPDIHFGKYADGDETGDDYNLEIAANLYMTAHRHIVEQAFKSFDIGRIINIPSNDPFHCNAHYTTHNGTRQDHATTWQKLYKVGRQTMSQAIIELREYAPVDVITHSDNHAPDLAFFAADAISCLFSKDSFVSVDDGPEPHKFYRHGNVLLGFGHGHNEKYADLQGIMANKQPEAFAQCTWREWHLGHLHKDMLIDGFHDLRFRRLPSLSGTDSWHASKGYRSGKAALGFVWSTEGLESVIYYTPKPEDYRA